MRLGVFLLVALVVGSIGWIAFDAYRAALAAISLQQLSAPSLDARIEALELRDIYINERIDTLYELRRN